MLLHKKERKVKEAMKLQRELYNLYDQRNEIKSILLDEPIQRGWKKFFVLRDDYKKGKDAAVLIDLLKYVNHTVYCANQSFMYGRPGKKQIEIIHPLHVLHLHVWHPNQGWIIPEDKKQWLERRNKYLSVCVVNTINYARFHTYCLGGHIKKPHYHFHRKWMLDTVIEPHFLTHYKPVDGDLESRIKRIDNTMYNNGYWDVLNKHYGWSYAWDDVEVTKQDMNELFLTKLQVEELKEYGKF